MKRLDIITLSAFVIMGLFSCEMREEIKGGGSGSSETGILELSVAATSPASALTKAVIPTDDFYVLISGIDDDNKEEIRKYDKVTDVPESITLIVGNYKIESHTPGELGKKMAVPYYGGDEKLKITTGITSSTTVKCKMKNSRIQINLTDKFVSSFEKWTITIDDGSDTGIVFTEKEVEPAPVYWFFDADVSSVTVNVRATTYTGNTIEDSRIYKKSDAEEKYDEDNEFFTGGDALIFDMGALDPEVTGGKVTGITITANIIFENKSEKVEIPVADKEDEPVTPTPPSEDGLIVISEPKGTNYLETGVSYTVDTEAPDDVELLMKFENGLAKMYVRIESTDELFLDLTDGMGLVKGSGLDLASEAATELGGLFPLPKAGDKEFSFSLTEKLFNLMGSFTGTHTFNLKAVDQEGNEVSKALVVRIIDGE
ncbi:DUF4493 domain-containing protein [Parabacteroides sp.]